MASNKRRRAVVLLNVLVGLAGLQLSGGTCIDQTCTDTIVYVIGMRGLMRSMVLWFHSAFVGRALPVVRRTVSQSPAPLLAPVSAKKADASDEEPKKPRARSSSKKAEDKDAAPVKKTTKKTTEAASGPAVAAPPKPPAKKARAPRGKPEGPLFDAALVAPERALEMYDGDEVFNIIKQGEDVVAPWSVGGFEIDLPDWRPQPAQEYEIVDPTVSQGVLRSGKILEWDFLRLM